MVKVENHFKKKTPFYKGRDKQKREEFRKKLEMIGEKNRVYVDESGINESMHRSQARAPCGEKVYSALLGNRFFRESFIAAKRQRQILTPFCYRATCSTNLFNTWLETMLIPELKAGQVVLDSASFHKSQESLEIIRRAKCEVLSLPSYSPDLNPIDTFWVNIKRKVKSILEQCFKLVQAIDRQLFPISGWEKRFNFNVIVSITQEN